MIGILGLAMLMPMLFWVSIVGLGRLSEPVVVGFDLCWNHYTYRLISAELIGESDHEGAAEF
jgi:hypothetical protein